LHTYRLLVRCAMYQKTVHGVFTTLWRHFACPNSFFSQSSPHF
jgi:hypothetical protein